MVSSPAPASSIKELCSLFVRLKCAVDQSIGKSDLELILGCQVIQYVRIPFTPPLESKSTSLISMLPLVVVREMGVLLQNG